MSVLRAVATADSAQALAAPVVNAPMRMSVGSANPLLLTQLNIGNDLGQTPGFKSDWNSGWSLAQLWASVPDDLKGNIGFVLHQGHTALSDQNPNMSAKWLEDNVKEADALGIPIFILWDEGRTLRSNSSRFTFLESLYQKYPHFMGTVVSEQADTLNELPQLLQLANNYGGFHVLGSLEEANLLASYLETQANWNTVTQYKQNFIFNPKNFHENFESVNAWTQGAWLSGVFDNWGPYFDGYPYYGCGIFGARPTSYTSCGDRWSRSVPETVSSMMMLDQWQNGATVFQLENQLDIPTTGNLYSPYFYQSILPAMRYILTHPTPTRADIIDRTKVAFAESGGAISTLADSTAAGRSGNPLRTTFYSMYEESPQLTAVQKQLWFYLRANGRYGIIPRIPKLAPSTLAAQLTAKGATVLTKATYDPTLMYGDERNALLDAKYPQISTGDAFVQKSGSTWLVYNTNDRDNINQDATIALNGSTFTQLQMPQITPHTWAALTDEGSAVSLTLDTYRTDREADLLARGGVRDMEFNRDYVKYAYVPNPQDAALRTTTLRFDVATRPTLTISGYDRNGYTYSEVWDSNTHLYTLTVRSNGVVNIRLSTTDNESGWTSVTGSSNQVVASAGATEFTFDGTSVAWVVPAGSTGTAVAKVDGVTLAGSVSLAAGGTVFRATGLTNSVHVLRLEGSSLPVASLKYVPAVEHDATTMETDDFNYGTQATDDDVLYGSEGWRVIDGKFKMTGFVFPFFGDTTVYNTNASLANVRLDAKMTLINGTSGALMVRGNEDTKTGYFFRLDPSRTAEGRTGSAGYSCSLLSGNATSLNSWTPVATCASSVTLSPNTEYSVSVSANNGTITASINGSQVLSYTGAATGAGYTGVRAPQAQSDSGGGCTAGGLQSTAGNYCLGQFVQVDDVSVTNLDTGTVAYSTAFTDWSQATGWMTETPLVFDWNTKADPRSTFSFPYQWTTSGGGTWAVTETTNFTSGMSGYYTATPTASQDLLAFGGAGSAWATDGGYDYWTWLRPTQGTQAGLVFRATNASNAYQVRLNTSAGTVALGKVVGGTWTQLAIATSPVPLATNAWSLVKVTAHGTLLTVDVGGKFALSLRDSTFGTGAAGVWVPAGGKADVEDARVVSRPAAPVTAARTAPTVVASDGIAGTHITGFDYIGIGTARTKQPTLPATVTARYSDGSKAQVAVSWPAITAAQLATSTNPTATGQNQGKFTVQGTVTGTSLTAPALVTVMPNLTSAFTVTGSYTSASPSVPTQVPGTGTFSDGSGTWTKYLYVRWDKTPNTAVGSPTSQVITGSINGYPWEKVSATVTVTASSTTTVPRAPIGVRAIAGNGTATVSWLPPTSNGGSTVTGYTVTASPGGATCTTSGATTCAVAGLTNGVGYTFTVKASNSVGASAMSFTSLLVTPAGSGTSAPSAPTGLTAAAGNAKAVLSWLAPASTGGTSITGYQATASPGGASCTTTGALTCTVGGLANGTTYTFTVTATNAVGTSPASTTSPPTTPTASNIALNKTPTAYGQLTTATRVPAKLVDGDYTLGWYSGGANDYAFSDGTTASTQGSLCTWIYVDLGADYSIGSYKIQFGENITTYGNMYDSPFAVQALSDKNAAAHTTTERNSSICTRLQGGNYGSIATGSTEPGTPFVVAAANDIWTPVSTGTGSASLASYTLSSPVTARYVRILINEPTTAHRYGAAVFEFELFAS